MKKIIAMGLCAIMGVSMLNACGNATQDEQKDTLSAEEYSTYTEEDDSAEISDTENVQINVQVNIEEESTENSQSVSYYVKNTNSGLNLRSEPKHDSALVYTVEDNSQMSFYGETGEGYGSDNELHTWYKVTIDGHTGWVRSDLIVEAGTDSGNSSNVTTAETPSNNSTTISQYIYEPVLDFLGDYEYLEKNVSGTLNVRSEPSYDSNLVCEITDKTCLIYEGRWDTGLGSDGQMHYWVFVWNTGFEGWVRSDLVINTNTTYYLKGSSDSINLRSEPKHNSSLVYTVTDNTPMNFYGEVETGYGSDNVLHDWYKVYLGDGISGWVRSDLIVEGEQHG